jgi:hypothetical protein
MGTPQGLSSGQTQMRILVVLGAASVLAACSAAPRAVPAPPPAPITCQTRADCEAKWSRAISWIVNNSELKIQTQSDLLIQTYNSIDASTSLAFTITRVATGEPGIYQITIAAGCANFIGCFPTPAEARASFAAFVDPGAAGAPAAPTTLVWVRKDHRRITGNPGFEREVDAARQQCNAEASAKGPSGAPAFEATYKACMDGRGYLLMSRDDAQRLAR